MSGIHRPYLRSSTREMIHNNAQYAQTNSKGELIDPNIGEVLDGKVQYGHVTGMENRGFVSYAEKSGMTQSELNNITNNSGLYQLESPYGNMSHQSEEQDSNQTALNTAAYCYFEDPSYQELTYINPHGNENESWTISTVNAQSGEESTVGTFTPNLGEVTPESQAAIQSAVSDVESFDPQYEQENDMSDFGCADEGSAAADNSASEDAGNGYTDSAGDGMGI